MKKIFLLVSCVGVLALTGVEVPFKRKPMEITLDTLGGGISSIRWKNHLYTAPGISFTERVIANTARNGKKAVVQENFHDLEFTPRKLRDNWNEFVYEFSARGTGAFDWLRLSKVYTLYRHRDYFEIKYTLQNLDRQPRSAALWVRSFVRDYQESRAKNFFTQGHSRTFDHPGNAGSDEWCTVPKYPFSAVWGLESKKGVMVDVPYPVLDGLYSWFSATKPLSSVEFITREMTLPPGKDYSFVIKVTVGERVPGLVAAAAKKTPPAGKKVGSSSYIPEFYAAGKTDALLRLQQRAGNTVRLSGNSMNLVIPKQFHDSVREAVLPDKADLSQLGIYEVVNKRADYSKEVPFVLEKRNGKNIVRFPVPGFKNNFLLTYLNAKTRAYYNQRKEFVALADYEVQICFDRKGQKKSSPSSVAPAGVFADSGFDKLNAKNVPLQWVHPAYYWSRGLYAVKNGAFQLRRPGKNPSWAQFYEYFVPEPGKKYTLSMRMRNDNLAKGVMAASVSFFDAERKPLPRKGVKVIDGREGFDWKNVKVTFYAPEKAAYGKFGMVMNGLKDQVISIDDLRLVPEPYSPETIKLVDRLRDQLKSSWYKPLDWIENNSHKVVTPHEKWLAPAAFTMPHILFLPFNNANYSSMERRTIVEIMQRMPLTYTMIPLLTRVSFINGSGLMGVYQATTLPELEPYTLEKLKTAPQTKVIWISELDFKKNVKASFIEFLRQRAKTSNLFFYNCTNIPGEFLGKKEPLPAELTILPEIRPVPWRNFANIVQVYSRGNRRSCIVNFSRYNRHHNPAVPQVGLGNFYNNYPGREIPYWEFEYLTTAKALRYLSQVKPAVLITSVKGGKAVLQAEKDLKASLEIRYEDFYRQVLGKRVIPCQLKKGDNTVTVPPLGGRFGEHIVYLKLKGAQGIFDAGAIRGNSGNAVKFKIAFPKGKQRPFGKSMPVTISLDKKIPGTVLEAVIEDADYRQVGRFSTASESLKFEFTPAYPRTVLYRVLVCLKEKGKVTASTVEEFSFTGHNSDPKELVSVVWSGADSIKFPIYKKLGFDHLIVWCLNAKNPTRVLRNLNMEPAVYGTGSVAMGFNSWHKYRGEVDTSQTLSPRKPCFSDAATWKMAGTNIAKQAKEGLFKENDVKFHLIGDEQFLGRNVCISEHCLKDFRKEMKLYYKEIGKLNAAWGTDFSSFDTVMPKTAKELADKSKLGAFVPHKLFMTRIFAEKYMAGIRRELKKSAPSSIIGLSGTANPGYHFDWPLVMKQLDYLAFYDGIQRKLAHDFANPGALGGQWYGGYVLPTPHEGYINSYFWRDLLSGNRLSANYTPRAGVTGDLRLTPQLEFYSKLLKESRTGIAKLIFSSKEKYSVAMVYSQSSLFAAAATIGLSEYENSLSGWHALLGDLGIDYKFLYAPGLPETLNNSYKVVILPCALALSDAEIAALRRFAAAGGIVIADADFNVYNEHGTLRKGKNIPVIKNVKLPEGEFRTTDASLKYRRFEKLGKGGILTLNFLAAGYQQTILGGVGGEVARELTGSEKFCAALRKIVSQELARGGVTRSRYLTGKGGTPRQAETVWREFNGTYLFGIWKFDRQVPRLDPRSGEDVTVTLPRKGHIYNVRTKKYLGYGNTFCYRLYPGCGDLFALLPARPGVLRATAPAAVVRGGEVKFSVELPGAGRVFYCQLIAPDGKIRYARTLAADSGKASGSFQIALNDPAGKWKFKFSDAATGTSAIREMSVK